jgi:predicted HTH transcriptional regulator
VDRSKQSPRTFHQLNGNIVERVLTPILAKHLKSFSLIDSLSVGVDRMQRNFEPMREQVEPGTAVN